MIPGLPCSYGFAITIENAIPFADFPYCLTTAGPNAEVWIVTTLAPSWLRSTAIVWQLLQPKITTPCAPELWIACATDSCVGASASSGSPALKYTIFAPAAGASFCSRLMSGASSVPDTSAILVSPRDISACSHTSLLCVPMSPVAEKKSLLAAVASPGTAPQPTVGMPAACSAGIAV